jgi:hypothetical protein
LPLYVLDGWLEEVGACGSGAGSDVDVGRSGVGEPRKVANGGRGKAAPRSGVPRADAFAPADDAADEFCGLEAEDTVIPIGCFGSQRLAT